ncbi:hypothetical protein BDF20DRAFT_327794 [Mycotypha africana]|uniref:uncharacterized protein n=1 Tax=Mycotypha africana TaxID=64632 RepID=UPI002300EE2E|nr:uncharacterized protein BDF20DRAFT_327794 [Mycotypha africana]KAI8988360.1 hypothetical protein BDF20DRAFT_327794 [Mycotypha africana]
MSLWKVFSKMDMNHSSINRSSRTGMTPIAIPSHRPSKSSSMTAAVAPTRRKRKPFECVICMSTFRINIPHHTEQCEHACCRECIRDYFQSALKDVRYASYDKIECPQPGCKAHFHTEKALYHFMTKSEMKHWWKKAIMKSCIHNKACTSLCHDKHQTQQSSNARIKAVGLFMMSTILKCLKNAPLSNALNVIGVSASPVKAPGILASSKRKTRKKKKDWPWMKPKTMTGLVAPIVNVSLKKS